MYAWAISEIRCKDFTVPSFIPRDSGNDSDSFITSPLFTKRKACHNSNYVLWLRVFIS